MTTGTVSHYGRKGFGWIEVDETHQSAFVHIADVRGCVVLHPGERVSFTLRSGPKGLRAVDVAVKTIEVSNGQPQIPA
jgi:cold shock CspA family protein